MRAIQTTDRRPSKGFTLIELMVVVAIIGLLIAIALPAFSKARQAANVTATRAMLAAIETSAESFKAAAQFGGAYPPSAVPQPPGGFELNARSPHTNQDTAFGGANFIAWALLGADLLGTPGFRDVNGNGTWADDTGNQSGSGSTPPGLYNIVTSGGGSNIGQPFYQRSGPYIDASKIKLPKQTDPSKPGEFYIEGVAQPLDSICFLDNFNQPILYYRATPTAALIGSLSPSDNPRGIYTMVDNAKFTGMTTLVQGLELVPGAGKVHPLGQLGGGTSGPPQKGTFEYALWNPNVTAGGINRPHRQDSFVLISAGPDGLYGTADDVCNYPTND